MSRSLRVKKLTPLILFLVLCAGIPLASFMTHRTAVPAHAASSLPYHEFANGPYKVSGNQIKGADGKQLVPEIQARSELGQVRELGDLQSLQLFYRQGLLDHRWIAGREVRRRQHVEHLAQCELDDRFVLPGNAANS